MYDLWVLLPHLYWQRITYCCCGEYKCGSRTQRSYIVFLFPIRSEEHTSELQSHLNLVCRLLLEKKNIHDQPLSLCDLLPLSPLRARTPTGPTSNWRPTFLTPSVPPIPSTSTPRKPFLAPPPPHA